jgi:uncharacterized protein (DUF736 family)
MSKITIPFFKNTRKQSANHPDYQLSFKDNNEEWQNVGGAWVSSSKNGNEYLSIQIDLETLEKWRIHDEENKKNFTPKAKKPEPEEQVDSLSDDDLPF